MRLVSDPTSAGHTHSGILGDPTLFLFIVGADLGVHPWPVSSVLPTPDSHMLVRLRSHLTYGYTHPSISLASIAITYRILSTDKYLIFIQQSVIS